MKFNSSLLFWILKIGVLLVTGKMTYQFSNAWFYGDWFVIYGLLIVVNVGEYFSARAAVLAINGFAKAFFAGLAIMAACISIMGSFGYMLIADEMAALQKTHEQRQAQHRATAADLANKAMGEIERLPEEYKSKRAAGAIDVLESYTSATGSPASQSPTFASADQRIAATIVQGIAQGVSRITTQNENNAKYTVVLFIAIFIELMVIGIAIFEAMDDKHTGQWLGLDGAGQQMNITPEMLQLLLAANGAKSDSAETLSPDIQETIKQFSAEFQDPFFNQVTAEIALKRCYKLSGKNGKIPWSRIAKEIGVKPQSVNNLWARYQTWLPEKKMPINGQP